MIKEVRLYDEDQRLERTYVYVVAVGWCQVAPHRGAGLLNVEPHTERALQTLVEESRG